MPTFNAALIASMDLIKSLLPDSLLWRDQPAAQRFEYAPQHT